MTNCDDNCQSYTQNVNYVEWNYYKQDKFVFIFHSAGCKKNVCGKKKIKIKKKLKKKIKNKEKLKKIFK